MEPIFRQQFKISTLHMDRYDRVKPSVLLYFAQEVASNHCLALSLDWQTLHKQHLFWAIIRQKMQISRLPTAGETITVETWPMPTTRVAYPRSTVAYDESGNEVFRAISLWVLMDTDTRNMILPGKSGIAVSGTLRGMELASPNSLVPKHLENTTIRTVGYTDLDRNGHMNNTKYLDWIDDLVSSQFHETHPIQDVTICYLSEALEGQEVTLSWSLRDNVLTVDGCRAQTDQEEEHHRVFSAQVQF